MREREIEVGVAPPQARTPAIGYLVPMRLFTPLLLATLLLAGCGLPTTADWRRCSFDISEVALRDMREDQSEWSIVVSAFNPGGKRLKLEGLHLWALMEGDTLARLRNPDRIDLAPRDTTRVSFDVVLPQAALNKAMRAMRRTGSSEILITGDATVATLFGTRTVKNAVREKHMIDLSSMMGSGDFLRNLLFR
jgi:hypothetical protein